MTNFRTLIATLKYHRCYTLFAMQLVHQPSFLLKKIAHFKPFFKICFEILVRAHADIKVSDIK